MVESLHSVWGFPINYFYLKIFILDFTHEKSRSSYTPTLSPEGIERFRDITRFVPDIYFSLLFPLHDTKRYVLQIVNKTTTAYALFITNLYFSFSPIISIDSPSFLNRLFNRLICCLTAPVVSHSVILLKFASEKTSPLRKTLSSFISQRKSQR